MVMALGGGPSYYKRRCGILIAHRRLTTSSPLGDTEVAIRLRSRQQDVARIDRRAVHERDDLVRGAAVVVDLPMGGIDIGEGGARP
jgi:hypothetical protein